MNYGCWIGRFIIAKCKWPTGPSTASFHSALSGLQFLSTGFWENFKLQSSEFKKESQPCPPLPWRRWSAPFFDPSLLSTIAFRERWSYSAEALAKVGSW